MLAEVVALIFVMLLAFVSLYTAFKKPTAIIYPIFSTGFFAMCALWSIHIPFQTDVSGNMVAATSNIMMMAVNYFFMFISLIKATMTVIDLFRTYFLRK